MLKLITCHYANKYEFEAETLDEILSMAIDAFDQSHELVEIWDGKKLLYQFCEIYQLINKRYY
jgi:hypothetical protein